MPNRILRDGILRSEKVAALSPQAELFYRRLMSIADDYGRYYAKPELLLSDCFPIRPPWADITSMNLWVAECEQADLVTIYIVDLTGFIEIRNFGQRIRNGSVSKFPARGCTSPHFAAECGSRAASPSPSPSTSTSTNSETRAREIPSSNGHGRSDALLHRAVLDRREVLELWPKRRAVLDLWPKFLEAYPLPTQVDEGCRMWISLCDNGELTVEAFGDVMAGLERWKTSKQWQTKGMRHSVRKWLHERRWKDSPEQAEAKGEY